MIKNVFKRLSGVLLIIILAAGLSIYAAADAPLILTNLPDSQTIEYGSQLHLAVGASEAVSFQWYSGTPGSATPIDGAVGSELYISNLYTSGVYYVSVSNDEGTVNSTPCTVRIKPVLTADISSRDITVNEGDVILLSASAAGPSVTAQWYYDGGEIISGQTANTLSMPATAAMNGRYVYCRFSCDGGAVETSGCSISVISAAVPTPSPSPEPTATPTPTPQPAPIFSKHPTGESVTEGGRAIFIARADNATEYKWRFSNSSDTSVYDYDRVRSIFPSLSISGGDAETLTISNIPYEMNGWTVYCVAKGPGGEANSSKALIQVQKTVSKLSISMQPKGTVCGVDENSTFVLSVMASATDGGAFAYQWYSATSPNASAMKAIPGANSSTYKPERVVGTMYYRVNVILSSDGARDSLYSDIVAVTFTEAAHVHAYSSVWENNDISHWHQCTCGDHADEAFHSYVWVVNVKATSKQDGEQTGTCSECGFETVQPIPAGSMPEEETTGSKTSGTFSGLLIVLLVIAVAIIGTAGYLIYRVVKSGQESSDADNSEEEAFSEPANSNDKQ